ncbi:Protein FAR1-RELATED SEQUENCE 5 [Glycine max]|nr:Protein FAR1-RELATED SEQUENCE 5 [Glycine max]
MNEDNGEEPDMFENIDCSDARFDVYDIDFVAVIMRSDTNTENTGRTSYVLIGCERSGKYRACRKDLLQIVTSSRKCRCPFKLQVKPVFGGEGWMVKLMCESHNHALAKSLVEHSYDVKTIVGDMTKSMVKPKNILLTLKEHNVTICTTMKQVCNARYPYRSSIRDNNSEMQQLMKLLERDQYIHWHRLKDEDIVRDIFWSHSDAMKLTNAYNLVFFIDSTYKTNKYGLSLLDIGEHINNIVWALEQFLGIFLRCDAIPQVIITDRDPVLMNAMKTVFPEPTNLLCQFHIDKNVKEKCKTLVGQKNAWDYVMEGWRSLFEIACSPWPMFVDYVKQTWLIPHKQRFVKA